MLFCVHKGRVRCLYSRCVKCPSFCRIIHACIFSGFCLKVNVKIMSHEMHYNILTYFVPKRKGTKSSLFRNNWFKDILRLSWQQNKITYKHRLVIYLPSSFAHTHTHYRPIIYPFCSRCKNMFCEVRLLNYPQEYVLNIKTKTFIMLCGQSGFYYPDAVAGFESINLLSLNTNFPVWHSRHGLFFEWFMVCHSLSSASRMKMSCLPVCLPSR